jgi:hypothetical protein
MHYFVIPALIAIIYIFIVRPKIKQFRAVSGIIEKADAAGASIWKKLAIMHLTIPNCAAMTCATFWRFVSCALPLSSLAASPSAFSLASPEALDP